MIEAWGHHMEFDLERAKTLLRNISEYYSKSNIVLKKNTIDKISKRNTQQTFKSCVRNHNLKKIKTVPNGLISFEPSRKKRNHWLHFTTLSTTSKLTTLSLWGTSKGLQEQQKEANQIGWRIQNWEFTSQQLQKKKKNHKKTPTHYFNVLSYTAMPGQVVPFTHTARVCTAHVCISASWKCPHKVISLSIWSVAVATEHCVICSSPLVLSSGWKPGQNRTSQWVTWQTHGYMNMFRCVCSFIRLCQFITDAICKCSNITDSAKLHSSTICSFAWWQG